MYFYNVFIKFISITVIIVVIVVDFGTTTVQVVIFFSKLKGELPGNYPSSESEGNTGSEFVFTHTSSPSTRIKSGEVIQRGRGRELQVGVCILIICGFNHLK